MSSVSRITVEECLHNIPNRFDLTLVAAYRARQLAQGHAPRLETKDKSAITALREISKNLVSKEMLKKVPM